MMFNISFFKLAFRNVLRNKRRTFLTLGSIVFGAVALIFVGGYIDYTFFGLRESTIKNDLGHIQIYQKGFSEKGDIDPSQYLLSVPQVKTISQSLDALKEVTNYSPRLSVSGIISYEGRSLIFIGTGVDPDRERDISTSLLSAGEDLSGTPRKEILLGKELAKILGVKVGDNVTLLASTFGGSINALDFKVVGFISKGIKDYDSRIIRLHLTDCQELLGTDSIERILVTLKHTNQTDLAFKEITHKLDHMPVELKKWQDLASYYFQVVNLYNNAFGFLKLVVLIVVILSIANTMVMSVMERTSEIGTLRAMGTTKENVMLMFMAEGLIMGILGGIAGVIGGILLAFLVNLSGGIAMSPPPGYTVGFQILIAISLSNIVFAFVLSVLAAFLSSIFPARKAANLQVVDALRHV